MTILTIIAWFAGTAFVIAAGAGLARRLGLGGGAPLVVHTIIICWSWIVLAAAGLSVFRLLSGWSLMGATSSLALASSVVGGRISRGRPATDHEGVGPMPPAPPWVKAAWILLLAFWSSHVVTCGLLAFTHEFDSLMYHIPLVDYWIQAASLHAPDASHWSNPGANELLGFWAVAPFRSDFLISLNNTPATLLLAFGALELAGLIGLAGTLRHLAAFAVVANFVVISQLVDAGNDVAVAALFVACLCYGLRFARGGRLAELAMFAAALGLLGGVKYYALGYAAVALGTTASLALLRRGPVALARVLVVGGAGAMLLGGYWYARNMVASGSPFYPLGLSESTDLLREEYPRAWESSFLGNGRPEVWPLALEALWKMSGPCPVAAVLALPTIIAWLAATGARLARPSGREGRGPERLALMLALVGSLAVLLVTPMALEDVPGTLNHLRWAYTPVRYGLSFVALAVLALALFLQELFARARPPLAYLPHAFLLGSAVYQVVSLDGRHRVDWMADLLACAAVLLGGGLWALLARSRPAAVRPVALAAGGIGVVAAIAGMASLARAWEAEFSSYYGSFYGTRAFSALESIEPPPSRVALFDYRCHPFFGADRRFRLCQPKRVPSRDWLVRYLADRGVSHVVVRSRENEAPAGWDAYLEVGRFVAESTSDFVKLHRDGEFSLYEFVGPAATRPLPLVVVEDH